LVEAAAVAPIMGSSQLTVLVRSVPVVVAASMPVSLVIAGPPVVSFGSKMDLIPSGSDEFSALNPSI
jgi:hypothetical protein